MPRGGYRVGSGRKKGVPKAPEELKNPLKKNKKIKTAAPVQEQGVKESLVPLEYMLKVMNDAGADFERRDRMAIAAAPYVHERAVDKKLGKKEQKIENAKNNQSIYSLRRAAPKLAIDNTI